MSVDINVRAEVRPPRRAFGGDLQKKGVEASLWRIRAKLLVTLLSFARHNRWQSWIAIDTAMQVVFALET
jgi:hypothetical protein